MVFLGGITNLGHKDLDTFLDDSFRPFRDKVKKAVKEFNSVKVSAMLSAEFDQPKNSSKAEVKYFSTANGVVYGLSNLERFFEENISLPLQREIGEFESRDSGWSLKQILSLTININKHEPLRGSSYIKLPPSIKSKHAIINVKNKFDNFCFKWSILSAYYPKKSHANELPQYKRDELLDEVKFSGLSFPTPPEQVEIFEKNNKNISVHLYVLKKKDNKYGVYPYYLSPEKKDKHFHLLIVRPEECYIDENEEDFVEQMFDQDDAYSNFHYVWIKDLGKLLGRQYSSHGHKIHICDHCLHFFHTEENLSDHENNCKLINKCKINLPKTKYERILKFKNVNHQERVPIIIFADIESVLKPIDETPITLNTKTKKIQKHEAHSIGFYLKNTFSDELTGYRSYRQKEEEDESPADWFVRQLKELCPDLNRIISRNEDMNYTAEDEVLFKKAKECHICRIPFTSTSIKVRDHCHYTSK